MTKREIKDKFRSQVARAGLVAPSAQFSIGKLTAWRLPSYKCTGCGSSRNSRVHRAHVRASSN